MTLEMVASTLQSMRPILDMLRQQYGAELVAMHPDTWHDLCGHYGVSPSDVPARVKLRQEIPKGQALLIPLTQFVTFDLVHDA